MIAETEGERACVVTHDVFGAYTFVTTRHNSADSVPTSKLVCIRGRH